MPPETPDHVGALEPLDNKTCPAVPAAVNAYADPVPYADPPAVGVAVALVPPFAIANVPARVIAPEVAVFGVRPVDPALKVVTPVAGAADHVGTPAASVRMYPLVPAASFDQVSVAEP